MSLDPTGITEAISSVSGLFQTAIDKIWPNPEDKAKADAQIMMATAQSAILQLEASQKVMLAEASSDDKWTSRARPSFLYVVYIYLLLAIPMGILGAFSPTTAEHISTGIKLYLGALPDIIVGLFQTVMLGYVGARTVDKASTVAQQYLNKKGN